MDDTVKQGSLQNLVKYKCSLINWLTSDTVVQYNHECKPTISKMLSNGPVKLSDFNSAHSPALLYIHHCHLSDMATPVDTVHFLC